MLHTVKKKRKKSIFLMRCISQFPYVWSVTPWEQLTCRQYTSPVLASKPCNIWKYNDPTITTTVIRFNSKPAVKSVCSGCGAEMLTEQCNMWDGLSVFYLMWKWKKPFSEQRMRHSYRLSPTHRVGDKSWCSQRKGDSVNAWTSKSEWVGGKNIYTINIL